MGAQVVPKFSQYTFWYPEALVLAAFGTCYRHMCSHRDFSGCGVLLDLPTFPHTCLPTYLPTWLGTLPTLLPTFLLTTYYLQPTTCSSVCQSVCLSLCRQACGDDFGIRERVQEIWRARVYKKSPYIHNKMAYVCSGNSAYARTQKLNAVRNRCLKLLVEVMVSD